eukprot:symbB.v1.2.031124.t1/scaffold3576.1/size53854/2
MSEHCQSGGSSSKPDMSQFQALEAKMKRNNSMPSIATRARQTLSKSGSMPLAPVLSVKNESKPSMPAAPTGPLRRGIKAATNSGASSTPSRRRPSLPGQPASEATVKSEAPRGTKAATNSAASTPSRRRPSLPGQSASASPVSKALRASEATVKSEAPRGTKAATNSAASTPSRRRPSLPGQSASASPVSKALRASLLGDARPYLVNLPVPVQQRQIALLQRLLGDARPYLVNLPVPVQ